MAKKKYNRTAGTKRLDKLIKDIIRIRDEHICQWCGEHCEGKDAHTSHVVPKHNGASWRRFDLLNVKLLCSHCHLYMWHKSPTEAGRWFAERFPHRDKYLEKYRYGKTAKISSAEMENLEAEYKEKFKELSNGS